MIEHYSLPKQRKLKVFLGFLFVLIVHSLLSCNFKAASQQDSQLEADTTGFSYPLASGKTYVLPDVLEEISGLTYLSTTPHTVFAIQDEDGILFTYDLERGEVTAQFQFAGSGDYEGIANDGKEFFILKSNGSIYSFAIGTTDRSKVKHHTGLLPSGEYESMAFDSKTNRLYVLCKSCKIDKKTATTTGYILSHSSDGELAVEKTFSINTDEIRQLDKRMAKSFKPSAMAKHPINDEWYIISSIDKALIVTDETFRLKQVVRFDRKIFEQPEGMVFDENLNLYISSEAGDKGHAEICKIQQVKK
ncbi:SdiA-regulated domain-containing protein [Sphingobacterium tabacisoli]|uniref:SdiA-regulated domain-containing protein n=1 Tax=Sphingobacterium tabacisoli TaxID=2044855 RepID=A0ABW5L6N1_9SPHI|nr:SdiA-regulated domain-containing protein [Sphingobacterium tabacisoli]